MTGIALEQAAPEAQALLRLLASTAANTDMDKSFDEPAWKRLTDLAAVNRVSVRCHDSLEALAADIPGLLQVRAQMRERARGTAVRGLAMRRQLLQLLRDFANAGIEVMPLKGPVVGELYYRKPTQREYGDLDLMVRAADMPRGCELMEAAGYHCPYRNNDLHKRHHIVFHHRQTHEIVELHWRISGPQYPTFGDGEFLWANSSVGEYHGVPARLPCTEAVLLYLCIHAYKHDWNRLQWWFDVPEVLNSTPNFDWSKFARLAQEQRAMRIVRATLQIVRSFLPGLINLPPGPCAQAILSLSQLQRVARIALGDHSALPRLGDFLRLRLSMMETTGDKLRLLRSRLTPGDRDREVVALPGPLGVLYYLVRPLRVFRKMWSQGRGKHPWS